MCALAVLHKDASDISNLGSRDWTVFDVYSSKWDFREVGFRSLTWAFSNLSCCTAVVFCAPVGPKASFFFASSSLCTPMFFQENCWHALDVLLYE